MLDSTNLLVDFSINRNDFVSKVLIELGDKDSRRFISGKSRWDFLIIK